METAVQSIRFSPATVEVVLWIFPQLPSIPCVAFPSTCVAFISIVMFSSCVMLSATPSSMSACLKGRGGGRAFFLGGRFSFRIHFLSLFFLGDLRSSKRRSPRRPRPSLAEGRPRRATVGTKPHSGIAHGLSVTLVLMIPCCKEYPLS